MTRKEALILGEKRYHGKPCKTCKETEKYTSNYGCVACATDEAKKQSRTQYNKMYWQRQKDEGRNLDISRRMAPVRKKSYNTHKQKWKNRKNEKKRHLDDFYIRSALVSIKGRAKKKGIPFSITPEDIVIPKFCPVLGIELQFNEGRRSKEVDSSPSIDRIIPKLGYVPGNVIVVSRKANRIKNDATSEEIYKVFLFYKDLC